MTRCGAVLLCACALASQALAAPGERPNPFAPTTWQPPAPPPAVVRAEPAPAPSPPVPPPPPAPPPLPYKFFGRYTADVPLVVLTAGERMIVARAGDTLDGAWRVDQVGGAVVEFTYLPMQMRQSLATGDAR